MLKILQNAVKITEKDKVTYLNSTHRHDFVAYEFENGEQYHLDGGTDYIKRGCGSIPGGAKIEDYSLKESSIPFEIRHKLMWGSRGKDGKRPLKYAPFAELELDHLKAILDYSSKLAVGLSDLQIGVINYWIKQKSKANSKIYVS